jgi:hypothetical protein
MKLLLNPQASRRSGFPIATLNSQLSTLNFSRRGAFTLLEVIIACAIFFMMGFSILELVTRSLAQARSLQQRDPDPGLVAATMTMTNQLTEGSESGDFEEFYPGIYPGYSWSSDVLEVGSNGLFQADLYVYPDNSKGKKKGGDPIKMSILLFRPGSKPGSATRPR